MATNSLTGVAAQLLPSTISADPSDAFPRKFAGLEDLQAHEVHDDSWVGVYTVVMHCSSLLSTLLAALTFHTIFNKSTPSMAMYRLYLLNCLCWGYFYSVVLGQIQPVFLAPLVAAYLRSSTLPKIFDSSDADFQWLILSEVCFLNYVLGLLLLLLYRFVFFSSSDSSLLARAMGSTSTLVVLMTTNTLLNLTIINLVVGYLQGDQDQFLCKLVEAFPQLSSLFASHRLIGYSRLGDFKFFLAVAETLCVLMITLLALTNWMLHRKKPKICHGTNNSKTTRLMTQLYHMNTVQIALIAIILLCPMVVGVTLSAYRIRSAAHRFWLVALALSSFHCCLDSLVILLYIRPYRDHLRSKWRRLLLISRKGPSGSGTVHANNAPLPLAILSRSPQALAGTEGAVAGTKNRARAPRLSMAMVVAQARQHMLNKMISVSDGSLGNPDSAQGTAGSPRVRPSSEPD